MVKYAAGVPSIGNALMQYIPILYAGKTLKRYYESSILTYISNTDYEGMIRKQGSEVRIRTVPEITIEDHAIGDVITNQRPTSQARTLVIDRAKRWSFIIEDIEQVMTDLKNRVAEWSQNASENMDAHIMTDVMEDVPSQAHADNQGVNAGGRSHLINLGGTTIGAAAATDIITLTSANVMKKVIECGAVLDERKVPQEGRFMIVDPLTAALIKSSDIKDASLTGDSKSPFRTGLVGRLDRFTVFTSNYVSKTAGSNVADDGTPGNYYNNIIFGTRDALTFATQLTKNKMQDDPNGFDMIYRGLQVYGFEVIRPDALGLLRAQPDLAA